MFLRKITITIKKEKLRKPMIFKEKTNQKHEKNWRKKKFVAIWKLFEPSIDQQKETVEEMTKAVATGEEKQVEIFS